MMKKELEVPKKPSYLQDGFFKFIKNINAVLFKNFFNS